MEGGSPGGIRLRARARRIPFYWDGKDAGDEEVEPGTYTYDVYVSQVDINDADYDPPKETSDGARFRSDYMEILRASDDQNNPIFEAEYHGYDDGGTPEDEEDDNYIYLVRYYKLRDFLFPDNSKDASEGEIWLYDPDLEKVGEWDIAGLECLIHEEADGLEASAEGIQHALLVPVPIALMDEGGTYRFVAHIKDDHAGDYREHRNRWALDLNSIRRQPGVAAWAMNRWLCPARATEVINYAKVAGYAPFSPEGDPAHGGSGKMVDIRARNTIRTLNRLCPTEPPDNRKYLTKNQIWAFYGHGDEPASGSGIQIPCPDKGITTLDDDPEQELYCIKEFELFHVQLVFLASCYSAGGKKGDYQVDPAESLAMEFRRQRARAVIGMYGSYSPLAPAFVTFNQTLWESLCKEHMTVEDALAEACKASKWWQKMPGCKLRPILFGYRDSKLTGKP